MTVSTNIPNNQSLYVIKKKIRNILVPLDGSKNSLRGLDTAIYIARQCQSTITGLYVMPILVVSLIQPAGFIPPVSMVKSLDITKELKADAKQFLESAKLKAAKKGIILRTKIMDGQPGPDILRVAQNKNNKIDLIVVGSRGRSSVKELFLGSTSNYIVHKAKVPVLLVK